MTDWERVRRLRKKGLDWDAIAADPKVGFTPPEGVRDAGRALKSLYLARKNRGTSEGDRNRKGRDGAGSLSRPSVYRQLPFWGITLSALAAVWIAIALPVPIIQLLLPVVPYLLGLLIVGLILVGASFVIQSGSFRDTWKRGVALGIVVGILLAGMGFVYATAQGVPNLTAITTPEPSPSLAGESGGWVKAANPLWTSGGRPVVLYVGSVACPFCSASSWAIRNALEQFGNLTGWGYLTSSPTDVYPNTPEVDLSASTLTGPYLSWDVKEGDDNAQITLPTLSLVEQAYFQTYDGGGGIPFLVIGGQYIHTGTLVDPCYLRVSYSQCPSSPPLTYQQVETNLSLQSGPVYTAVHEAQIYLEAYLVKVCEEAGITPPSAVASDPQVSAIVADIS
jgi:hypothetical protein